MLGNQSVKSISTAELQMRGFNVCFLRKQAILLSTGIMCSHRVPEAACVLHFSVTEASTTAQVRRHLPGYAVLESRSAMATKAWQQKQVYLW